MGHKGGQRQAHDACIAYTAVGKKASLRTKATVNSENIKPVALCIIQLFGYIERKIQVK